MQRTSHLVLPFLGLLALFVVACQTPVQPPPGASGAEIYVLQLCANCHEDAGQGGSNGPPLRSLAERWTRADLADFLGDTTGWERRDPRLGRLAEEYAGDMKPYDNLSLEERLLLADHLLSW